MLFRHTVSNPRYFVFYKQQHINVKARCVCNIWVVELMSSTVILIGNTVARTGESLLLLGLIGSWEFSTLANYAAKVIIRTKSFFSTMYSEER